MRGTLTADDASTALNGRSLSAGTPLPGLHPPHSRYHGDAVAAKNCTSCSCDQCGSARCDNGDGHCDCKPNVEGANCDSCIVSQLTPPPPLLPATVAASGLVFRPTTGASRAARAASRATAASPRHPRSATARPASALVARARWDCAANTASTDSGTTESTDARVSGTVCSGWDAPECSSPVFPECDCEADLSMGTVCDVRTGQCHCQEGATGARCDQCLQSYLRIPTFGCRRKHVHMPLNFFSKFLLNSSSRNSYYLMTFVKGIHSPSLLLTLCDSRG